MKAKEIRKMSAEQLAVQLHESRLELAKERAASEIGTVKNPGRIRVLRKTIARIQTVQNAEKRAQEKKLQSKKPQPKAAAENHAQDKK